MGEPSTFSAVSRTQRRQQRRKTSSATYEASIWAAATTGDAEALGNLLNSDSPEDPDGGHGEKKAQMLLPLLHECVRGGYGDCVEVLLREHGPSIDLAARVRGFTAMQAAISAGHAHIARTLDEETRRRADVQAASLLARQSEATGLADQADALMHTAQPAADALVASRQHASVGSRAARASAIGTSRDHAFWLGCEYLAWHGELSADLHALTSAAAWLHSPGARELFADLAESLPGHEPPTGSPTEVRLTASELVPCACAATHLPLALPLLSPTPRRSIDRPAGCPRRARRSAPAARGGVGGARSPSRARRADPTDGAPACAREAEGRALHRAPPRCDRRRRPPQAA
jgi:hypothetical protein